MPIKRQTVALALGLFALTSCNRDISNAEFIRCWGGDLQEDGTAKIQFQAIAYPRGATISATPRCPDLRLILDFEDASLPSGFHLFDMTGPNPFVAKGIAGIAFVSVRRRDGPRLVVSVNRFASLRMLSDEEQREVFPEGS